MTKPAMIDAPPAALQLQKVSASYGGAQALRDVTISVPSSGVTALLGANGAGKTTTLRVASGLLRQKQGTVTIGGTDVTDLSPESRARLGMCLIPEGRGIFRSLTVRENLELLVPPWHKAVGVEPAIVSFPVLGKRLSQLAGSLSGGEQQMLAFSRAHLVQPKLVLLDEVSLGLAPIIVDEIFASLSNLVEAGSAVLLVEQYIHRAIEMADYVYVLSRARVAWEGRASELDQEALSNSYLGAEL